MSLSNIKTVILLMFENRSFDHMLGHLSYEGLIPDADGLNAPLGDYQDIYQGDAFNPFEITGDTQLDHDVPHEYNYVATQLARSSVSGQFTMAGFVEAYAAFNSLTPNPQPDPMGFFPSAQVPVTSFLARNFCPCDRWFCSLPTSTQPNRTMAFCGQSGIFHTGMQVIPATNNIFDWMDTAGISWRVYHDGFSFFALYPSLWGRVLGDNFTSYENLFRDMQAGTNLPQVIIVEPSYQDAPHIGPDHPNDNHAPLAIGWGEDFLRRTYQALTANAPLWQQSMMVVYYDEHGGFFDHVPPPPFDNSANAVPPAPYAFDSLGPRIPGILVSPWVDPGVVSHQLFDHTSVLQFLAELFTPGTPYSAAVAERAAQGINSISSMLTDTPANVPAPAPPADPIFVQSALGDNIATPPSSPMGQAFEESAMEMIAQHPDAVAQQYPDLLQWQSAVNQART
jgi:phospholipase C